MNSEAHVCYLCAQPIISTIRENTRNERGPPRGSDDKANRMRLFRDILDIASSDISALTQVPIHPHPPIFPWGTSELVGTLAKRPQQRIYRILSNAPPTENLSAPSFFCVPFKRSTTDHYKKIETHQQMLKMVRRRSRARQSTIRSILFRQ